MESFIFIISTPDRDRHNTVANINGWILDNYRANPVVHWGERAMFVDNNPDEVIGTSEVWIEDGKLYAAWTPDTTSDIARKIANKLRSGTSLAASVKFIAIDGAYGKGIEAEGGSRETFYYSRQELLTWKIVPIGSNPKCIYVKNYKGDKGARAKARARKMKLIEMTLKHGI